VDVERKKKRKKGKAGFGVRGVSGRSLEGLGRTRSLESGRKKKRKGEGGGVVGLTKMFAELDSESGGEKKEKKRGGGGNRVGILVACRGRHASRSLGSWVAVETMVDAEGRREKRKGGWVIGRRRSSHSPLRSGGVPMVWHPALHDDPIDRSSQASGREKKKG